MRLVSAPLLRPDRARPGPMEFSDDDGVEFNLLAVATLPKFSSQLWLAAADRQSLDLCIDDVQLNICSRCPPPPDGQLLRLDAADD